MRIEHHGEHWPDGQPTTVVHTGRQRAVQAAGGRSGCSSYRSTLRRRQQAFRRRPSRTGRPARAHGQARGLAGFIELAPLWQHDPVFRRVVVHRSPHVVDPHAAVPKPHLGPRVTLPFRARIPRARRATAPGLLHVQRWRRTVGGCAPRSATACRSALRSTAAGSPAAGVGKSGGVPIAPAGDEVLEGAPQLGQALALLRDRLAAAGTPGPGSGQSRSANTGA